MHKLIKQQLVQTSSERGKDFGTHTETKNGHDCCDGYYVLLIAAFYFTGVPIVTALQNSQATLPCPDTKQDVTWTRFLNGKRLTLVIIKNGKKEIMDENFDSLPEKSLVVKKVSASDSTMYLCNQQKVYLNMTTDPNMVDAENVPVTPRNNGLGFGLGQGEKGIVADAENQHPSDFWKIPVGAVVGAALMLLSVLTMRLISKKRRERNANVDKSGTEVIYEEIQAGMQQPRRESDVESPYYCTSFSEIPSTSTSPNDNLYSTVNKLKTKGRSNEECVYYLAEDPTQSGKVNE